MRVDRLLAIVIILLDKQSITARELSQRFSVSIRTIQRDMESLNLAGVPVFAQAGTNGGYGIVSEYKVNNSLFSNTDFLNLITALRSVEHSLGDNRFRDSLDKVKGLLPRRLREEVNEMENVLYIDYSLTPGKNSALTDKISKIEKAIQIRNIITFEYTGHKNEAKARRVEPMTLILQWGSWYLFAYCRMRDDYRLFKISRMQKLVVHAEQFKRRKKTYRQFISERPTFQNQILTELVFIVQPAARSLVEERHTAAELEYRDDGSIVVQCTQPEEERMYRYLLSYGDLITIVRPERVRERVKEIAQKIAEM